MRCSKVMKEMTILVVNDLSVAKKMKKKKKKLPHICKTRTTEQEALSLNWNKSKESKLLYIAAVVQLIVRRRPPPQTAC